MLLNKQLYLPHSEPYFIIFMICNFALKKPNLFGLIFKNILKYFSVNHKTSNEYFLVYIK